MAEMGYQKLDVWNLAMDLAEQVYIITKKFPKEELFALTNQMRRCAVSVPSNIAEGATRQSQKEFLQFISIARGSLSELETQIILAKRIGYMNNDETIFDLIVSVKKMLNALMRSLRS